MRKYPPFSLLLRKASRDYKVRDSTHVIEKDTRVLIPVSAIHYDDRFYKNPYKFDPDRFSPKEIEISRNFAFLPFGDGPRNCIGTKISRGVHKLRNADLKFLHF